jgi:hypothetical protein
MTAVRSRTEDNNFYAENKEFVSGATYSAALREPATYHQPATYRAATIGSGLATFL